MRHPFADMIGLAIDEQRPGYSRCALSVLPEKHHNPHAVVHGAVMYALADTGMGIALYPSLEEQQICATIEIKMNYFKSVTEGLIVCETELINRGRTIANLESRLYVDGHIVAQANGNYAIIPLRKH